MLKIPFYCIILSSLATRYCVSSEKTCVLNDARTIYCSTNEFCVEGHCQCVPGYVSLNDECIKNRSDSSPRIQPDLPNVPQNGGHSHLVIAIVVPVMLILIFISSVVIMRKYNLVSWIRNKIHQRDTPYDEVMIGQDDDDPPLSGV